MRQLMKNTHANTYLNTSLQAGYSRFIGPQPLAIRLVSGMTWTFSKPHSLAFLFLTFVGIIFTHISRMLPKHNARTPGLL
jgi:hypothetical protein